MQGLTSLEKQLFQRYLRHYRPSVMVIVIASVLLNMLVFAGSLYMLVVYDSVLPSGSVQTLLALFGLLIVVYVFQALFEAVRSEALLDLARKMHRDLGERVHHATVSRPMRKGPVSGDGLGFVRDLDQLYMFLSSSGPVALIDLPWVIVFLLVLTLLHWWLGLAALAGVLVLAAIAWTSSRRTQEQSRDLATLTGTRQARLQAELQMAEPALALGMRERLLARSAQMDAEFLDRQGALSRIVARFGGAGKAFRLFVQSMVLTVGALLVIDGEASGGIILAASVLSGRALAPVDQAIANWRGFVAAREGWSRLIEAASDLAPPPARSIELPPPSGDLSLRDVWVAPPGTQMLAVKGVTLNIAPGDALAIIGPSAAGKTTLAKAILGIWPPARGEIRLDGATHDQWHAEMLGASLGYVPQNVELVAGTIGENIARFDPAATSDQVMEAARDAGMHETILAFPDGYDTPLSHGGAELSAGQRQRIGLARALYGKPHIVVLDEANSNLDQFGDEALAKAIADVRARKGIVIMITHRPATLGPVSHIAVLDSGRLVEFGTKEKMLDRSVKTGKAQIEGAQP